MTNLLCTSLVQGESMRVTRLDECGNPEYSSCAFAVSDGFASITLTPAVEEGERFLATAANGRAIVNQRSAPDLNWYDVTVLFHEVDPELFTIITGLLPYMDDANRVIGFPITEEHFATADFALETWMGTAEEECLPGDELPFYMYNLLPWVVEGALAEDLVITNDLITFTVTARTRKGNSWGVGPYNVLLTQAGNPSPLFTEIPTDTHHLPVWTQLAPPVPACGCQDGDTWLLYPALDLFPGLDLYPIGA